MAHEKDGNMPSEGARARKRRETLQRITDAGINLFIKQGYEATTLDEIAAAAGISRRTFFYYFDSKDDILLSLQSSVGDMIIAAVRNTPSGGSPRSVVRQAILQICGSISPEDMIAIDKLMRSNKAVQARKQASYIQQENALFEALRERWPEPEKEMALRLLAMSAVGAMRLSADAFNRAAGAQTLVYFLNKTFDTLEAG